MKEIIEIKPNKIIFTLLCILLFCNMVGELLDFKEINSSVLFTVLGSVIAFFGFILHVICHKYHKYGHDTSDKIVKVVEKGIFGKIRHPMYLGILLIVWGMVIAWNFYITIPIPILITFIIYYLARKEEQYLLKSLSEEYKKYMKKVKWMFIPGVI